jgi:hypothetical protein
MGYEENGTFYITIPEAVTILSMSWMRKREVTPIIDGSLFFINGYAGYFELTKGVEHTIQDNSSQFGVAVVYK